MRRRRIAGWCSLSGVLALGFYALHVGIGQRHYPGYDARRQAVSDLTAVDAPSYAAVWAYAQLYGLCACVGCLALCVVVQDRFNRPFRRGVHGYAAMNLLSWVGYGLFPLSGQGYQGRFQDVMHLYVVTGGVVLTSLASLTLLGVGGLRKDGSRPVGVLALVTLAAMIVGAIGVGAAPPAVFGIFERFSVFSVVLLTAALGVFGFGQR